MDQYQASNDKFVDGIKKIYKGRALLYDSVQWPPVRGDKLIKLELVETEKASGFLNQELQRQIRSPILKRDIFSASKSGHSQVKIVVIEGIAGIGKTTLCKMLTEEWAAGEIFNSFEIVLLLPLREEGVSSASSFLDILAELYPSLDSNYMLTRITENQGEGILIIADGWDELRVKNREANSFLYKLLICRRVLPFASVILTSRPTASAILHSHSSVDRFIEVVGFSEENIRNFIQSEIADPSQCLSLLNQLEINPLLLSICTIPLNCSIVCNLWHTRKQKLPDTLTELYTLLVKNIVRRDVNKKFQKEIISSLSSFDCIPDHNENFWQICRFAFQCLAQDQLTFSDKVFPDFFSNDDKMFFGLLQPATTLSCDGNKLSFHFIHLTVQEYLAALHVATLSPKKRKHIITQNADNSRFFTLWRFMFGLGGNQHSEVTSRRIENLSEQEVLNLIQSSSDSLLLSQYAFESNDVIITQKIARIIRGVFTKATGSIARSPYDCAAICNVLQYTTTEVCDHMFLNISNCGLSEKMLMEMTDNICRGALSVPPIVSVHLDNNNLPEEAINDMLVRCSKQFFNLEALSLAGNNLSKFFIIPLTNLTVLSLSNNPLGVEGIQLLEEAIAETQLNKLQWLDLANTLVADADINGALLTSLLNCLLVHSPDLVQLDISENNLSIPGACALGEAVNMYGNRKKENYLEINMNHTNLSDEAFSALALAEALNLYGNRQNENYLEINMNHTNLSDEAFSAFVHCAVSNRTVSKGKNCLKLVLHIAKNPNLASITLLHQLLYCNGLVIALNLERTGIFSTKVEHDHTYSSIQQATVNTSLSWLVLDGNKLNGNHILLAEVLVACRSLSLLSLQKCSITTQDLRKLNECLIKSSIDAHVLNFWDLSSNNIDDQGITFLKNEIHNFFPSLLVVRAIDNPVKDHTNLENVLQFMLINLNLEDVPDILGPDSEFLSSGITSPGMLLNGRQLLQPLAGPEDMEELEDMKNEEFFEYINGFFLHKFHTACQVHKEIVEMVESFSGDHRDSTLCSLEARIETEEDAAESTETQVLESIFEEGTETDTRQKGEPVGRPLTIDVLMRRTEISSIQLDKEIIEHDLDSLAECFDNVETYLYKLGLNEGQQTDIKDRANQQNTKTAMVEALKLWRQPNPFAATFRALLEILLDLRRGDVAVKVCKYIKNNLE